MISALSAPHLSRPALPTGGSRRVSPAQGSPCLLRWVLCRLLPVWLCLSFGWVSAALAAADDAPMCDPHGASVAAQAEAPIVERGKLEALPCEALLLWLGSGIELSVLDDFATARDGAPPPAPELQQQRARSEAVMAVASVLPGRSDELRLPESDFRGVAARPGHRTPVFRPPLTAGC